MNYCLGVSGRTKLTPQSPNTVILPFTVEQQLKTRVKKNNSINQLNKTLEHITGYYVIFIVIGQFACSAHQTAVFGKSVGKNFA